MLRPYVISWNLTYRCNLACEHCYLDAGAKRHQRLQTLEFSDRSELSTEECFSVIEQISSFAPEAITILTGGEPLLRRDILAIVERAVEKKLWVVIGTNGILVTQALAKTLLQAGVRGLALSLDALEAARHDAFRKVKGAWENTVQGALILAEVGLPFIIQTTVGKHNLAELAEIAEFAFVKLKAKVWNLYFLVQSGRGQFVSDISAEEYEEVLGELSQLQLKYRNQMMINAKCAPHFMRYLYQHDQDSPFLKTFSAQSGGCPAGSQYLGIRPNGDLTPCPYLPLYAGNLRDTTLSELWSGSPLFQEIRGRQGLTGRCGACEFGGVCGGCRARAFAVQGSVLAEDPLCGYQPGKYQRAEVLSRFKIVYGETPSPETANASQEIVWEEEAKQRMEKVPAFVRGMVVKAVEAHCAKNGLSRVSVAELESIRERMPLQKVFGGG